MESATAMGDAASVTRASSAFSPSASSRVTYVATISSGASVGAPFTSAERRATRAETRATEAPSSSVSASARASIPKHSSAVSAASPDAGLRSPSTRSSSRTARRE